MLCLDSHPATAGSLLHPRTAAPAQTGAARLLLVGVGPHARRTYVPHLRRLSARHQVELLAAVDLEANAGSVRDYAAAQELHAELHFVTPFTYRAFLV